MAHNLMVTASGASAYIGRQSAWHTLGTVTGQYLTFAEVMAANDHALDFTVFKSQLNDGRGKKVNACGSFRWDRADRMARNADAAIFLGVVGADYEVIQHAQGFAMVDALVGSVPDAHYETAGALGVGEKVWGLADLLLEMRIGDDIHRTYLLFCTGHDGSMSFQFRITSTRVVCENTLNVAVSAKTASKLTVKHTKNAQTRISDIMGTLSSLRDDTLSMEEKLQFLATRRVTKDSMVTILDRLYPKSKGTSDDSPSSTSTRRDNVLASILALYESNDNNAFLEQRGTAYNLLNAITEHTDHIRTSRGGNRAESAMFGTGDKLKSEALRVLVGAASDMPEVATTYTYAPAPSDAEVPATLERYNPLATTGSSILDALCDMGVAPKV